MKSQINTLRQLQELVLTRDEHNQTGDGSHLDALNDAIDALQQKLEPQMNMQKNKKQEGPKPEKNEEIKRSSTL